MTIYKAKDLVQIKILNKWFDAIVLRKQSNKGYIVKYETTKTIQNFTTLELRTIKIYTQIFINHNNIKIRN